MFQGIGLGIDSVKWLSFLNSLNLVQVSGPRIVLSYYGLDFSTLSLALCLSLTNVSTLLWMEMERSVRTTWGGRSMWWRRWSRCSLAWSPWAVTSWEKSEALIACLLCIWVIKIGHLFYITVCYPQTASSGHWAESEALEASAELTGDVQPPTREWPKLLSGGSAMNEVIRVRYISHAHPS